MKTAFRNLVVLFGLLAQAQIRPSVLMTAIIPEPDGFMDQSCVVANQKLSQLRDLFMPEIWKQLAGSKPIPELTVLITLEPKNIAHNHVVSVRLSGSDSVIYSFILDSGVNLKAETVKAVAAINSKLNFQRARARAAPSFHF